MSDPLTVDDLVNGQLAAELGEGRIATAAVVLIEVMSEHGAGLHMIRSEGLNTWHAIGMLRSGLLRLEAEDLDGWGEDDDE